MGCGMLPVSPDLSHRKLPNRHRLSRRNLNVLEAAWERFVKGNTAAAISLGSLLAPAAEWCLGQESQQTAQGGGGTGRPDVTRTIKVLAVLCNVL
jgi:hypothetical protein